MLLFLAMLLTQGIKIAQQIFLFVTEVGGGLHVNFNVHIAASAPAQIGHPFTTQGEHLARLGTFRDTQRFFAMDGDHFSFDAKRRIHHGKRQTDINIIAVTAKKFMRLHRYHHVQITGLTTTPTAFSLTLEAHAGAAVDTGGNFDGNPFGLTHQAGSPAVVTGLGMIDPSP